MTRSVARDSMSEERIARIYFREVGSRDLLEAGEERRMFERLSEGDPQVREEIIKANLRLVIAVSRQYRNRGLPLLDLIEEGNCGLLKAVEKFDVSKGYRFSTYAIWWIRQSIERALANQSRLIRLPLHVRSLMGKISKAQRALVQRLEREPSDEELATATGLAVSMVRWVREVQTGPFSLDQTYAADERSSLHDTLTDADQSDPMEKAENLTLQQSLVEALRRLPERERSILVLRYGLDNGVPRTLGEVGKRLGLTRERIRQIQLDAVRRLRRQMNLIGWGRDMER